jgi:NitT/TauT family transport system substrate-binding protein
MVHLHVRFLRYSAFYTPLLLALDEERLRTEGLRATFDTVTPEKTIDEGFRDGSVHLAQSAPAVSFVPSLRGTPPAFRHFALMNSRDGFFLGARNCSEDFSWSDLEGRTVLVDHFFQPLALFRTALRRHGVDLSRVRIVDAGNVVSMEAAFRAGQGDFVHLQGPAPQQLEVEGACRIVASMGEAVGPIAFSSLCAPPAWLDTDAARRFMRVYERARSDAHTRPAEELATCIAPRLPGVTQAALAATVAAYRRMGAWSGESRITKPLYDATVDVFVNDGYLDGRPEMSDVTAELPSVC